jgi:hypothetical protein
MKCTEPETFAVVPDSEAPDELVERFLDHLSDCDFHAQLQRREENAILFALEAAQSVTDNGELPFSDDAEAQMLDLLDRFEAFRVSGERITALSLKVDGREIATLDFAKHEREKLNLARSQSLQIFGRCGKTARELLLGTYVPVAQDSPGSYFVPLDEDHSLRLEAQPLKRNSVLLEIRCITESPAAEQVSLLRRLVSANPLRLGGLVAAIITLFIIGGVSLFRFVKTNSHERDNNEYVAQNQSGRELSGHVAVPPGVSVIDPQKKAAPLPHQQSKEGGKRNNLRSGSNSDVKVTTLRDVHTVYVDDQEIEFRRNVRTAVKTRLAELGFNTDVDRADSDARLRMQWKGNTVSFQILSGNHSLLNFKAHFNDENATDADELALSLKNQIQKRLK